MFWDNMRLDEPDSDEDDDNTTLAMDGVSDSSSEPESDDAMQVSMTE